MDLTRTAYGTWSGGRFMHFGEPLSEEGFLQVIQHAYQRGIRTFMTADVYGSGAADEMLGRALTGLPRDSYCLVGAVGHDFYSGKRDGAKGFPRFTHPALRPPQDYAGYLRMAVEKSLERCGADRSDLAAAFRYGLQVRLDVLHVAHPEVVVEVVVEVEGLLHVLGVSVVELDAGLLAPEEIGDEAHEPDLRELLRVTPHGVVYAPNLHDGDDRRRRRSLGEDYVRAHRAVAQGDADVPNSHQLSRSSSRALPEKMRSFSALGISSAFTAARVSRISMRPCSASKGASVANRQCEVPKKAWPQRAAAADPFTEVSA